MHRGPPLAVIWETAPVKQSERLYDIALSDELRIAVRERRKNPDGQQLYPKITMRGNTEVLSYPWAEMSLGDFFFVPLRGQKPGPMSVRLRQVAARKDWELTIVQWKDGTETVLRVCLTLFDVSEVKAKAQAHHGARGIRYSDGKWGATRKARYRRAKGTPKLCVVSSPVSRVEREAPPIVTEPEQQAVGVDASLSPEYDREKVVRERLAALGIKP